MNKLAASFFAWRAWRIHLAVSWQHGRGVCSGMYVYKHVAPLIAGVCACVSYCRNWLLHLSRPSVLHVHVQQLLHVLVHVPGALQKPLHRPKMPAACACACLVKALSYYRPVMISPQWRYLRLVHAFLLCSPLHCTTTKHCLVGWRRTVVFRSSSVGVVCAVSACRGACANHCMANNCTALHITGGYVERVRMHVLVCVMVRRAQQQQMQPSTVLQC